MRSNTASEDFYVIGLGLPPPTRVCLSAAFPRCILYTPTADGRQQTAALCDLLGKVVLFAYIPAMPPAMWLRASAVFKQDVVKVIGVHPDCTEEIYNRALDAEFAGVIEADAKSIAFQRAVWSVQLGELWFPRAYLSRRTRESLATTSPGGLSGREADILNLLGDGMTNQNIADTLCISRDTVRWHLRSIYTKLGVSDRDAAFRLARNKITAASSHLQKSSA